MEFWFNPKLGRLPKQIDGGDCGLQGAFCWKAKVTHGHEKNRAMGEQRYFAPCNRRTSWPFPENRGSTKC